MEILKHTLVFSKPNLIVKILLSIRKNALATYRKKNLSGKGKLTNKLIDKLTVYYGLAIRRNSDSADKMKDAIWASYYHYSSTDKNPQHQNCPEDPDTWCNWQRASAFQFSHRSNTNIPQYQMMLWLQWNQFMKTWVKMSFWSGVLEDLHKITMKVSISWFGKLPPKYFQLGR